MNSLFRRFFSVSRVTLTECEPKRPSETTPSSPTPNFSVWGKRRKHSKEEVSGLAWSYLRGLTPEWRTEEA